VRRLLLLSRGPRIGSGAGREDPSCTIITALLPGQPSVAAGAPTITTERDEGGKNPMAKKVDWYYFRKG
jgi:hypothetical protein